MVGIPRSTACQNCKRKRIKCDQNWPTCGQCLRSKLACQGPSSLSKFVNNGEHRVTPPTQQMIQFTSPKSEPKPGKLVQRGQASNYENGISMSVMRLQTPRAGPPTTSAERLAIKLNNLLKDGTDNGICRQMRYLPHLRQRLGDSICLRDSAALFCSAWADYRRRAPVENLISPQLFGKALRSLTKAVKDNKTAYTAETLGAMALLERTESLFGLGRVKHLVKHFNGIKHVLQQKGAPNMDDGFDIMVTFENQGALFVLSLVGDENYMSKEDWEQVSKKAVQDKLSVRGEECFLEESGIVDGVVVEWPTWVQMTKAMRRSPGEMEHEKIKLLDTLRKWDDDVERVVCGVTERATSLGFLREISDVEIFTLGKYEFGSLYFARKFAATLLLHLVVRRFIYDIGIIYGTPDASAHSRYQDICVQQWMFIPYMITQDPLDAMDLLNCVYLSIEAAEGYERDCFLEAILEIDRYQKRLPTDKKKLEADLLSMARSRFGRPPPPDV